VAIVERHAHVVKQEGELTQQQQQQRGVSDQQQRGRVRSMKRKPCPKLMNSC
jgi:hypothetical protein